MRNKELIAALERWAPLELQEDYDNAGLQVGDPEAEIEGAMVCLDCTEAVVNEAERKGCGLVIAHHPVIFRGLKSLVARGPVERTLLSALRQGVAIYAIHTNLDNVIDGVNGEIADRLGLSPLHVLDPKGDQLAKLVVFVPRSHADPVRDAIFAAGAGRIGRYDECSFNVDGRGTFRAGEGADPFVGALGVRHEEPEVRIEAIFHRPLERAILAALTAAHPYEEAAFDVYPLANAHNGIGSGLMGEWDEGLDEGEFLGRLREVFGLKVVRHTAYTGRRIRRVALCGGSGAFLLRRALAESADAYVTGDVKYHEFFEADGRLLFADIGHYASEQFTMARIKRRLGEIFPTFAVHLTETVTDPIHYS